MRLRSAQESRRSNLKSDEVQVLILASTGDMALAAIVADSTGVDLGKIREQMKRQPDHWAHEATALNLIICSQCTLPGWPDCGCPPDVTGGIRVAEVHRAYNYKDRLPEDPAVLFHPQVGTCRNSQNDPGFQRRRTWHRRTDRKRHSKHALLRGLRGLCADKARPPSSSEREEALGSDQRRHTH